MENENIYKAPESGLKVETNDPLEYAGFWIRVGAAIIDTIMILVVTLPLLYMVYGDLVWNSTEMSNGTLDLIISYVFPAVATISFWFYKSATPGKMLVGIEVISLGENKKLSWGQSIGRYCAYYLSMLVLMLGIIWIAFDKKKQGWHDKLANTVVVKKR